ncbi:transposase, partial [Ruminococcus sp.]|uniref:transposase n=1 Tax=Ruminococcus sp. TaxID=41978 RepID=UPI0025FF1698
TIERVFADAKEKHSMRYTNHRGLSRVTNWVRLKFAAMNLKKYAIFFQFRCISHSVFSFLPFTLFFYKNITPDSL